jgi:hypothetical protein
MTHQCLLHGVFVVLHISLGWSPKETVGDQARGVESRAVYLYVLHTEAFMTVIRTQTSGCLVLLFVCALGGAPVAYGQGGTTTATLSGRVFDGTGGTLPGATVTVVNIATNQSRVALTNDEGVDRELGSIEPGKIADIIVVEGNPNFDITALSRVEVVVKDGVPYKGGPAGGARSPSTASGAKGR